MRRPFYRETSLTEVCVDDALLGAAHDGQRERVPGGVERVEQLVERRRSSRPPAATSRSPRCRPAAVGRAARLDAAHEQARRARAGRPRRAACAPRAAARARGRAAAAPAPRRGRARRSRARSAASAGSASTQPALHAHRVEPEQPALGVDERAARGAARQRRRVLDRAADAAPARPAERAAGRGDEAERRAQAAAAGVGEREHGQAGRDVLERPPAPTRPRARRPVSTSITATSRSASTPATRPSATSPSARLTATSSPRSTCALVSTRPSAITTPEPRPQPRPSPTTAGPTRSAAAVTAACSSSRKPVISACPFSKGPPPAGPSPSKAAAGRRRCLPARRQPTGEAVTCNLQVTRYHGRGGSL